MCIQRGRPTKARLLTLITIRETSCSASNSIQPELNELREIPVNGHGLGDELNPAPEEFSELAADMASLKAEIVSSRISDTINGKFRVIYVTRTS